MFPGRIAILRNRSRLPRSTEVEDICHAHVSNAPVRRTGSRLAANDVRRLEGCVLVDGSDMSSEILGRAGDGQRRWRSRDRGAGKTRGAADVMLGIAAP